MPVLFDIQFDGLCDLQSRACMASPVYGDVFIESEDLLCRITPVLVRLKDSTPITKIPCLKTDFLGTYNSMWYKCNLNLSSVFEI